MTGYIGTPQYMAPGARAGCGANDGGGGGGGGGGWGRGTGDACMPVQIKEKTLRATALASGGPAISRDDKAAMTKRLDTCKVPAGAG